MSRRSWLVLVVMVATMIALLAPVGSAWAHTDPTSVSPAAGQVVTAPPKVLRVTYPEPVSVFSVTVSDGRARSTVKVGKRATSFAVPVPARRGAYAASWDTRMPDGDTVTQATTWRVGRMPGSAVAVTRRARTGAATVTVRASDSREGAPVTLAVAARGASVVEVWLTTAGVEVPLGRTGGKAVLVADSSVSAMVLLPSGDVQTATVRVAG